MNSRQRWQQKTALFIVLGISTSAITPLLAPPAQAQVGTRFADVQGSWAESCISSLAQQQVISGYPDGSFRPDAPVSRAEFAAMVNKAFPNAERSRSATQFADVTPGYWAYNSIRVATETGFLSGYPGNIFRPNQNIPRAQVLVALANGLNFNAQGPVELTLNNNFDDANAIPDYARSPIAAATNQQLVVNYPNVRSLNPNQLASRGEVAAFLCQAMANTRQANLIPTRFIAGASSRPGQNLASLPAGTSLPVAYAAAERVVVTPDETVALTLTVAENITNSQGRTLIPAGAQIVGQLQPRNGGSQFVANQLVIRGQEIPIQASSPVITRTTNVNDPKLTSVVRNAAIGSAAAAGISGLVGDRTITAEKVLPGAAVGAAIETNKGRPVTSVVRDTAIGAAVAAGISGLVGDRTITPEKVISGAASGAAIGGVVDRPVRRVVVINPDTDLTLTLDRTLVLE